MHLKNGSQFPVFVLALIIGVWTLFLTDLAWITLASILLGWTLLALALNDWRHLHLPDMLTFPLIAAGLGAIYQRPDALPWHVAGAAIGYIMFQLIAVAYHRLRGREGLGQGDAKLMAAAGAWVGLVGLPSVILIGSVAGLFYTATLSIRKGQFPTDRRLPFGSFLCLGIWITWLYGPIQLFG